MTDIDRIREKCRALRDELARAEGEAEQLQANLDAKQAELAELLGCKPGGVKRAIEKLREQVERDTETIKELLDKVEAIKQGEGDE